MVKSVNTAEEYDIVDHNETSFDPETLAKIRDWLQPTDYLAESGEFRRHLSSQAPGTGLWLLGTDEYHRWHDSPDHGSLWIKGVPGAGKSVVAASVIQHLRTTEECPVLFFFFRNIVAANFSPRALIQDWLAQLLPHSPKLQFALQARLKTSLAETSDNDLIQLFLDGTSCVPKLYCVSDALDEMTLENRPFLDKLNSLATHRPRSLKLLMTSRPKQYLQSALRDTSIVHISLQQHRVDADIISFLNHRLDTVPGPDGIRQSLKQVVKMVSKRSGGLFLYAKLTMDQLEDTLLADGPVDIRALEESLPVGLEQTYTNMLAKQRIEKGVSMDLQVLALEAVTHACRPLRLNELTSFVQCLRPDEKAPAGLKALVATCCGPLIQVLEDETLQVIHHSFTEYLRGDTRNTAADDSPSFPIISSDKAHKRMAIGCLQYLQSGAMLLESEGSGSVVQASSATFEPPESEDEETDVDEREDETEYEQERHPAEYRQARLRHPFLGYAVGNWSWHASRYDVKDEELFAAITGFLQPDSLPFRRWLALEWKLTSTTRGSTEGIPGGLHIAAFCGMSELIHVLVQQGSSVSALDAQERTPLHWAAFNGHAKAASLLIELGGDPNPEDERGLKPIHLASRRNHASIVTVLLETGVEPDTWKTKENCKGPLPEWDDSTKGETAILYACKAGHTEVLVAMIPFCKPSVLERLLCEAARCKRTEAVLAILEKSDVSGDAVYRGATALHFACRAVSPQCVEALLKRGADVRKPTCWDNRLNEERRLIREPIATPPLHRLVLSWYDKNDAACRTVFRLLLDAGADLEQLDGKGNTALLIAAGATDRDMYYRWLIPATSALLAAGADVSKTTRDGDTALHGTFRNERNREAVRLLIEHGSDPNHRNSQGRTPLQCCLSKHLVFYGVENMVEIAKYLVDHGADPTAGDDLKDTAVYRAMKVCPEIFPMMLSRCRNMAIKRTCWFGLSSHPDIKTFQEHLETLLAEGIDINTKREADGRTLYLCCLSNDEKMRILRDHGADPDMVDGGGNNALHILGRKGTYVHRAMEKHIAAGANPLATNSNGDTLLHHATLIYAGDRKAVDYVRWLISLGVPVNAVNSKGETALHASQRRFFYVGGFFGMGFTALPPTPERVHFADAIRGSGDLPDFEIRDSGGLTALHRAAMASGSEVALLARAGADIAALTSDSQNALHLACRARRPNIVLKVLEATAAAGVNQNDRFGKSPLHYACASGDPESVAFLLKHGADVHAASEDGSTPLHACADPRSEESLHGAKRKPAPGSRGMRMDYTRRGRPRVQRLRGPGYREGGSGEKDAGAKSLLPTVDIIVKMLIDASCDLAAVNKDGFTALDVAINSCCAEFVEVFAESEMLFTQATRNLDENEVTRGYSQEARHRMRTQMALLRPRPPLEILGEDKPTIDEILRSPSLSLELLSRADAANLINEGFLVNPNDPSYYDLVRTLMENNHLRIIEQVPHLVSHYSYTTVLEDKMKAEREADESSLKWMPDGDSYYTCWTALHFACRRSASNMITLQHLVEKLGIDVNAQCVVWLDKFRDDFTPRLAMGSTALHLLAEGDGYWQLEAIRYLARNGAHIDALNHNGESALHIAAKGMSHRYPRTTGFWKADAIGVLIDHGADINLLDEDGLSALHKASSAPDVMRELLQRGADVEAGARNPLFQALHDQNLLALETLLDHGVSVDSQDERRNLQEVVGRWVGLEKPRKAYALACAAYPGGHATEISGSVPLLLALVERGANLYLPMNDEDTLIHFLFEFTQYEVSDALLKEPCVSRIDFDRRDQRGRTVLMAACAGDVKPPGYGWRDWEEKVTGPPLRMLDRGADATLTDDEGKTALHHMLNSSTPSDVALEFINREEVAPVLLQSDGDGLSPLQCALRCLHPVVCELLDSKGADLLEIDPVGQTALHRIAGQCLRTYSPGGSDVFEACLRLWRRVLAEGCPINARDSEGNTPLHTYLLSPTRVTTFTRLGETDRSHLEVCDELFPADCGVDVLAVNDDGETALHMVARRKQTQFLGQGRDRELFEAMMGKGVDPLAEDARGRSALDVASACGKNDIVELLKRK